MLGLSLTGLRFAELRGLRVRDVVSVRYPGIVGPRDLRHTAASLWIADGMEIRTVSAWQGHSTTKLTLDTYGRLMERRTPTGAA